MQNNLCEQFGWSDYSKASKNHRNWISAPSLVNLSRAEQTLFVFMLR